MKKILMIAAAALVAIIVVFAFGKNLIIKAGVESGVKLVTGLDLNIRRFSLGILSTHIGIEDLRLYNPPGYKDSVMIDIPEIFVDYELGSFFRGAVHLEEMRLNMKELVIVRNEKGELNLDALKVAQPAPKEGAPGEKPKEKGEAVPIQLDNLDLQIGKVIFKDYSRGGDPVVKEYALNIRESHQNIGNLNSLVSLIVAKALTKATLAGLTQVNLGDLQGSLSTVAGTGKQLTTMGASKVEGTLKDTVGGTTESLKETTTALKEKLKIF